MVNNSNNINFHQRKFKQRWSTTPTILTFTKESLNRDGQQLQQYQLSPQIIEHKKKTATFAHVNPGPGFRHH